MKSHLVALLGGLLCASVVHAGPVAPFIPSLGGIVGVRVLKDVGHAAHGVCFTPIGETVVESESMLRCSVPGSTEPVVVPAFLRQHDIAPVEWAIDVSAALSRTSWRGNAVFSFYDMSDEGAVDEDRYTAIYQADVGKANKLHTHVHLSPSSGFQKDHVYRMRVGQIIKGDLVVLAEGDFRLE